MKLWSYILCVVFFFTSVPGIAAETAHSHDAKIKTDKASVNIWKLPTVLPPKILRIKDGGSATITAGFVRERIGNKWVRRLAYNRMIPGPILSATQNANIRVTLINKTGAPTTLHPHGLRVDDRNDGVPGVGQDPIADGGSFTYNLKTPDAGMFWYHPHMREDWAQELGLYGNIWVSPTDPLALTPVSKEEVIVLDDLLLQDGDLPFTPSSTETTYALMGRYGNIQRINNSDHYKLAVKQGDIVRFFVTNVANARPFRLRFNGARIKLIGADSSLYEQDTMVDDVTLGPAERVIVDVYFPKVGAVAIENANPESTTKLGFINVSLPKGKSRAPSVEQFETLAKRDQITTEMKPIRALQETPPAYSLQLDATVTGPHADHVMDSDPGHGGIEWEDSMSEMSSEMTGKEVKWRVIDTATGHENMEVQLTFQQNVPAKLRIANTGTHHPMQHPIHFHGQRMAVIARDAKPEQNLVWKDTVLIPAGSTYDIVLDNQNPGRWMGHCHIAEHLAVGMMFGFSVEQSKK